MTKALRVPDYLGHILKAIERIDRYTVDMDEVAFLSSELVQDAVIRNIEIIGEASNNIQRIAPAFAAQHDEIPWLVMYTMRNRVSHGYDKVLGNCLEDDPRRSARPACANHRGEHDVLPLRP